MASSSFRDSMNSLGWSRRADGPVNTSQQSGLLSSIRSLNPFGSEGYVRLPTTEGAGAPLPAPSRREEEDGWFACKFLPSIVRDIFSFLCTSCHIDYVCYVAQGLDIVSLGHFHGTDRSFFSKQMGSNSGIYRLQSWSTGMLCDLFCAVSSINTET
jgi:hypothetical protein